MAKRVLVTRALHQASELAERLRGFGLEPVLLPAITFVEPTSWAALDAALAAIQTFDWILFTSANAVKALQQRLNGLPLEFAGSVAAIGPATARAVQDAGLPVNLLPPSAVAEALADALLPYARREDGTPQRFLLIRAEQARDHLPEALTAAGALVTDAPAYRTVVPEGSAELLRSLVPQAGTVPANAGLIDAITFTSSSTVRHLLALCAVAGVDLPPSALRVSIGPITSDTLREHGLPPHAEAPEATVAALAETVATMLSLPPPRG